MFWVSKVCKHFYKLKLFLTDIFLAQTLREADGDATADSVWTKDSDGDGVSTKEPSYAGFVSISVSKQLEIKKRFKNYV